MLIAATIAQVVALCITLIMLIGITVRMIVARGKGIGYAIPFLLYGVHYIIYSVYYLLPDGFAPLIEKTRDLNSFWLSVLWLQGVAVIGFTARVLTRRGK